jgi:hypothetical protein
VNIGKIERAPIRQAFQHEALNFTKWLEDNIDALSGQIGLNLTVIEREKAVGSFNVDLVCETQDNVTAIVENQLERTDHDHLGKLLTYMVNLDAKIAVWVTTDARQEHARVIDWLNASTAADTGFYLVQVEAIRIGDSPYAPLFTVLARPDEQTREISEGKRELAERHILREQFWTQMLARIKEKRAPGAGRSPSHDHWLSVPTGRSGIVYNYLILKNGAAVDLYIDTGNQERNKAYFDALFEQRDRIEAEFDAPLSWRRLDNKRASRVVYTLEDMGSLRQQDRWDDLFEKMIEAMIRFESVFRPRIRQLD